MNAMPFNNKKYIQIQKDAILSRIQDYERLYIEVGGKIFDDYHASRVLPGFEPNVKIEILKELKNDLEILFCVNARHIISKKAANTFISLCFYIRFSMKKTVIPKEIYILDAAIATPEKTGRAYFTSGNRRSVAHGTVIQR